MYVASDGDLQTSLRLADARYEEVQAGKEAQRRAHRQVKRDDLEKGHVVQDKALRCASKEDKSAGNLKRAREKESLWAQLETEQMADEDEAGHRDSRVRMALLSEKLQAMDEAQDAHVRQFDDPAFHFVPRRKMMQIQSGCIETMCQVLDKNNRTNTWQRKDVCVVEQCMSALALRVHCRPERCRQLLETKGAATAIVTGMRECAENRLVQETGLKLVADTCLALASFAEAYVAAGALETIVDAMNRFGQDRHLQTCGCEAISAAVAALPRSNRQFLEGVIEAGAQRAVGRASLRHCRSEAVLVATTRALETITLQCCSGGTKNGRACVQQALLLSNRQHRYNNHHHGDENHAGKDALSTITTTGNSYPGGGDDYNAEPPDCSFELAALSSTCSEGDRDGSCAADDCQGAGEVLVGARNVEHPAVEEPFGRGRGDGGEHEKGIGATAFALRVADSYSRDDSRTIVRRAGAARVAASALGLVRALLTDCIGSGGQREEKEGEERVRQEGAADEEDEKEASLACIEEFCREQGVEILISAMEHHVHDATVVLAASQAVHSAIRIARYNQTEQQETQGSHQLVAGGNGGSPPTATEDEALARKGGGRGGDVSEALLQRGMNIQQLVSVVARAMDIHQAVAPLQWICLVCLIDLHALDARVSDMFMVHSGCQVLHRSIRTNAQHTAVVEQGCRAVAVMSEPSFTSRTRFFVENIQDTIHEAIFLHRRHPGVHKLGNRALDALWGGDEIGAKKKATAAERFHKEMDDEDDD